MKRIDLLRNSAYENGVNPNNLTERNYIVRKTVLEYSQKVPHNIKRAEIDCTLFDNYSIEIDPNELLVGRYSNKFVLTEEQEIINKKGAELIANNGSLLGISQNSTGHRVIDYEKLLTKGIDAVIKEIDSHLSDITYENADDYEKFVFYTASKISLEGVCRFAKRYREKLVELSEAEKNPHRKKEYLTMADNFKHAPFSPCTHFHEALQCMWFMQFALCLISDKSLTGRPDNYLFSYYKNDINAGILTRAQALELIEGLYFKHNEIYDSWPASIMLAGVDRNGNSVCNELTYLFVEAIETTALVNPAVAICYTEDLPADLIKKSIDIIAKGYTRPSFFNHSTIEKGLLQAGVEQEDARYYIHSTCVEITPIASSNILVATPYINLNKSLEYILGNKKEMFGDECSVERDFDFTLNELDDFDKFYSLTKKLIGEIIRTQMIKVCRECHMRKQYKSSPLSSAFLNNCLDLGKDSGAGGAKYNFVYPCFPGFSNLVDSLSAIKTAVYDGKVITLEKLSSICKNDFFGEERLRQFLLNRCPKFGNGLEIADEIAVDLYDLIRFELSKYKNSLDGTFHPSYFAYTLHGTHGKAAAATPDGRRQGQALSECLSSVQGMDKNGPLGVLESIEKIDQSYGIGGIATNFRFSKDFISSNEGKTAVINFIHSFMDSGSFEIQFNVIDQQDLLDAKENPEQYKTLMVRVAGYSDYFVNLSPEIQDEIIRRTEHGGI